MPLFVTLINHQNNGSIEASELLPAAVTDVKDIKTPVVQEVALMTQERLLEEVCSIF